MADMQKNQKQSKEKALFYQQEINRILKQEKIVIAAIKKTTGGEAYKKLVLADEMVYMVTLYLAKYNLSLTVSSSKSEDLLNDARKALYKVIICLEEIVSNYVDVPFEEIEEKIQAIKDVPCRQRYYFIRKLGLVIDLVIAAYGENNKWKWTFVEIQGRFAAVAKNIINLKDTAAIIFNPRHPEYESTVFYLRMLKRILEQSAGKYRERYELVSDSIDDFRIAIQYLSVLHRIHTILNDRNAAEEMKKKMDVWSDKLEKDLKRRKR